MSMYGSYNVDTTLRVNGHDVLTVRWNREDDGRIVCTVRVKVEINTGCEDARWYVSHTFGFVGRAFTASAAFDNAMADALEADLEKLWEEARRAEEEGRAEEEE